MTLSITGIKLQVLLCCVVMPSVSFFNVMLSFIMLSAVMLSVMVPPGQYSQHLIFFVTYKWAQKARAFVPSKPFKPGVM
jgi:hypothetical protein